MLERAHHESAKKLDARATGVENQTAPSVFDFRDYRAFLAEWFRVRKSAQSSYS